MDRVPGKLPNTSSRLIAMAASLTGDTEIVRLALHCTPEDFRAYRAGQKELPYPELDRLIGLIVHEQGLIIAKNRDLLAEIRARRQQRDQS